MLLIRHRRFLAFSGMLGACLFMAPTFARAQESVRRAKAAKATRVERADEYCPTDPPPPYGLPVPPPQYGPPELPPQPNGSLFENLERDLEEFEEEVEAPPAPSDSLDLRLPGGQSLTIEIKSDSHGSSSLSEPEDAFSGRLFKSSEMLTPTEETLLPRIESVKPLPAEPIPDNPPPHEGAMIDLPVTIEPPDLVVVEVLETLPGRPITGERLVRPDGTITLGFYGNIYVRGLTLEQVKTKIVLHLRTYLDDEVLGLSGTYPDGSRIMIQPKDSDRVFVDVSECKSKSYFIQGDVAAPGEIPITGKDTVLNALNLAGGLTPTADATDAKLYRPARGDQPRKIYKLDLKAIEQGDKKANLQVFPDDRIVVGRDPVVQSTIMVDRMVAPFNSMISTVTQLSAAFQFMDKALDNMDATPEQRRQVVDRLTDLGVESLMRPEHKPLDEEQVRRDIRAILEPLVPSKPDKNGENKEDNR